MINVVIFLKLFFDICINFNVYVYLGCFFFCNCWFIRIIWYVLYMIVLEMVDGCKYFVVY